MQLMSLGGEFIIIDRSKLGYEILDKTKKKKPNEVPNINENIETLKAVSRENKLAFRRF
jgi:hypothetical protein